MCEPEIDVYATQDDIERSLLKVVEIIDGAKEEDPEFYEELKEIFST
jgi:predicted RecB family endonuclease